MNRFVFIETERLLFSNWTDEDLSLAKLLWGNPNVTKYICAQGIFKEEEIILRLKQELENNKKYCVQYWPIFTKEYKFVGCCGLRPHGIDEYEIGFHLLEECWHQGYAKEAASAVIDYARKELKAKSLFAGHNPKNEASKKILIKLGFKYTHDEFYKPTGLLHPSYKYLF